MWLIDTDGNNYLDEFEIEALFQIELDKVFNSSSQGFDQAERDEEMARMREHVFTEMDKNKDKMISLSEFIDETKQKDFNENEEWKVKSPLGFIWFKDDFIKLVCFYIQGVEDEAQFNEEEFQAYSSHHQPPTPPMQHVEVPESPQTVHH